MEQIRDNIFRIGVPLRGNPLKEVNSYLIRGKERDLLIDTGFRRPECVETLQAGLQEAGSNKKRLDIFLTHLHSDHTGMSADIAGADSRIYLHEKDLKLMEKVLDGRYRAEMGNRFVPEGMPADMVERIQNTNPARLAALKSTDSRFVPIQDGHIFQYSGYELQALLMPGHSPGQMMLWLESEKIMFTGDHVLFDITPNITAYVEMEDALGSYLESLERAFTFPVEQALPGHRKPGNYHDRIRSLTAHHEKRIAQAKMIVTTYPGLTAYDITGHMTWKIHAVGKKGPATWEEFPKTQRWYAVGECLSHLDYLRKRGVIRRENVNGVFHYFPVK